VDTLWGEVVERPAALKDRDLALAWLSEALGAAGAGAGGFSGTGPMGGGGGGDGAMQLDSPPAGSGALKTLAFSPSQGDADAPVGAGECCSGGCAGQAGEAGPWRSSLPVHGGKWQNATLVYFGNGV